MWFSKLIGLVNSSINKIGQVASVIAVIFLVAMTVLTTLEVILRYAFNAPIPGSTVLNEYLMVCAGFLGLAWCAKKGGHIKVDMLVNRLPPRGQAITDSITLILAMTVMPLVAWQCIIKAKSAHLANILSDVILKIPVWPFYLIEGLSFALLVLVMLTLLFKLIRNAAGK